MSRKREIFAGEVSLWLGILLDAAFDPTGRTIELLPKEKVHQSNENKCSCDEANCNLTQRDGRSELLSIVQKINNHPERYPPFRAAEMLLEWANRWVTTEDWKRLQARLRKKREKMK